MIRKRLLWLPLVVALAFVATACPGQSGSGGTTGTTPTTIVSSNGCVGPTVIPLFGDSNGTQLPQYMNPAGYQVASKAYGGSAFTEQARANYFAQSGNDLPTIVSRVHEYLTACPLPAGVVIQGSTNDWGNQVDSTAVIAAVSDLNVYLTSLGVKTFWVSMHPVPHNGSWNAAQLANMAAYNSWLLTPGNVNGTVIDSALPLQDSGDVGWLKPAYYAYESIFSVDPRHVSPNGYIAWVDPITSAISIVLNT